MAISPVGDAPTDPELVDDFLVAAALQQLHRIRHYIEQVGLHPDCTRVGKPTALCYASLKPNITLVEYYLEKGADVNQADAIGMTPLHYAAMGGCVMCLARLIAAGARINTRNRCGETPLAAAVYRAHCRETAELLQRHGAVIGSKSAAGDPEHGVPRFH
ncbi:MAG: ankyrin repeat domain-containing protein [Gammaproteobacteria bacterium]|nr:ankyrin repeat domain-containing protein [Gammaproteobacteria bacterium]